MKQVYIWMVALAMAQAAMAQNKVELKLGSGEVKSYDTAALSGIDFDGSRVTVNPIGGESVAYEGSVRTVNFRKVGALLRAAGWLESAYAEWSLTKGATYRVYIKGGGYADWTEIDRELVRLYASYGRADVVGLRPGSYRLRVVPTVNGSEGMPFETEPLTVTAHDRSGFAHKGYAGVGAYNDDGTLKKGAVVVYVNAKNARTVTAKLSSGTFTGLQGIINAYQKGNVTTPLAIRVLGLLKDGDTDAYGSSAEGIQIKGRNADCEMNITVEGIGEDATVKGFGFLVRNAKSVEFRNLGIMRQMDDGISLDTDNSNIWVHHIDVFYGRAGSGDHAKGDGAIDVKSDSKFVTVSYCHFWDTGKSSMAGMKSESGPNYITYHHNWFDHSDSRHARVRTMSVHLYNNYFDGVSKYGVGATTGSSVFVERNYFRATHNPLLISLQGTDARGDGTFSGEPGGLIKAYGNVFAQTGSSASYLPIVWKAGSTGFDCYEADSRSEKVPSSVVTLVGGTPYNNFDTNETLMYAYTPDEAADVPAKVTGYYGAGRLNHGDLQYTFAAGSDDSDYGVNAALAALLDSYEGAVVQESGSASMGEAGGTPSAGEPGQGSGGLQSDTPNPSGATPIAAPTVCSFDKSGKPSSPMFAVVGNGSASKGTATYDGTTYNTCLKMESGTSIGFSTTATMKLVLVFGDKEMASFKLDGKKYGSTAATYTVDNLEPGSHVITKADSRNLFLVVLE